MAERQKEIDAVGIQFHFTGFSKLSLVISRLIGYGLSDQNG